MKHKYLISMFAGAALVLAATAACEKGTPVGLQEEGTATANALATSAAAVEDNGTPDVLYACYNPSGSVYRIKEPGLPDACHSGRHVEFSWNEQGPQGPPGDPGESGPPGVVSFHMQVSTVQTVNPSSLGDVSVYCPDGEVATGGGFEMYQQGTPDWSIRESYPRLTGTTPIGWRAVAVNLSGSVRQFRAWVICATLSTG